HFRPGEGALMIEPMGTLAYVGTTIDKANWPGMNFDWKDATSFRGTLALRLSADYVQDTTTMQPFILGGIGQEFNGDNKLMLMSGSDTLLLTDKPIQTFGIASIGV